MKTGLKRTFFPLKMFFPVIALGIVGMLVYGSFFKTSNQAEANIALFYPANCLGGWKNVDRVAGQPEVRADNDANYSDENSASISNSNAQVFCGGFAGEIPTTAKHQKVTVNFSWYIGDDERPRESKDETEEPQMEVINEVANLPVETPPQEPVPEASEAEEIVPEPEPAVEAPTEEPASEPTAFNFYNHFFNVAHAQEETPEPTTVAEDETVVEEVLVVPEPEIEIISELEPVDVVPVAESETTPTDDNEPVIEVNPSEGAYFEVLYTLNGQDWHTLGFVSRIANDVQIEMPIDLFATVEDLNKVQVALHTVERFDSVPKIYLDALWLEVRYLESGEIGVHEIMDVSPVIYPIEIVIGTTTATSTENQYPRVSIEQFINGITRVQGLDERYVLVTLITTGERRELWLFDMIDETIRQIGVEEAEINEVKPVARDGLIFWINKEHRKVFTYDLRTSGKLYKFTMAGNLPYSDERILAFPFTGMSLVQRGEQLVIFTNEAGEVFTDENNESTKLFFEKFDLTKHLSDDLLSVISDTYVVSSEIEQITE